MNRNERNRVTLLARVKQQALMLVAAEGLLGLGYRQVKRVWQRYRTQGDGGLVHRSRGWPSGRATAPEVRERVLLRCAERYPEFGPMLAAKYLRQEGLSVDHETLRRWQIAAEVRTVRRWRQHLQWREHKVSERRRPVVAGGRPSKRRRRSSCRTRSRVRARPSGVRPSSARPDGAL